MMVSDTATLPPGQEKLFEQAGYISAAILRTPQTGELWSQYHHSRRNDNPALKISGELAAASASLQDHPELMAFMKELIAIERGALGKEKDGEDQEIQDLRTELQSLEDFLNVQSQGMELPKLKDLPEEHRKLLGVLRHHTAQSHIRPVRAIMGLFRETWHHVKEEAKEHPKTFSFVLICCVGALAFMRWKMGSAKTMYIEPHALTNTNLDLDALTDPNYVVQTNDSLPPPDLYALFSHDHLTDLVGPKAADVIRDLPVVGDWVVKHSAKAKTLVPEAQQNLQEAYDFINLRIGSLIKDPAESLGNTVIPDSPFKQAFDKGANATAEFIYAANTIENVVLHSMIALTGFLLAYKAGTMTNDEARENMSAIKDFFRRSWANSKLSYLFGTAATTYAYMNNHGMNPEMIWMGLGGVLVGEFTHQAMRKSKRQDYVQDTLLTAKKDLANFAADADLLVSDMRAGDAPNKRNWMQKLWSDKRFLAVTGTVGALIGIDTVVNDAVWTGYTTGGSAVLVPFMAYNAVEDTFAHIIFGITGGAFGFMTAGGKGVIGYIADKTGLTYAFDVAAFRSKEALKFVAHKTGLTYVSQKTRGTVKNFFKFFNRHSAGKDIADTPLPSDIKASEELIIIPENLIIPENEEKVSMEYETWIVQPEKQDHAGPHRGPVL
jgi:hypothetical protein